MKQCTQCGIIKSVSEFYIDRGYARPECKECHLKAKHEREAANPYRTVVHNMISGIFHRTQWSTDKRKNASYTGTMCLLGDTPAEARITLDRHFGTDIKRLISEGKKPSVDRIDSNGHYEIGNIEIIPLEENIRKGAQAGGAKMAKRVRLEDMAGHHLGTYDSVSDASRILGMKRETIIRHAKNGTTSRNGFCFRYI
jgi:hypothetical protein